MFTPLCKRGERGAGGIYAKKVTRKIIFGIGLVIYSSLITNCSFVSRGQKQEITIAPINDKMPEKTRCVLKNEEGVWKVIPNTKALILRDENDLEVQCVNTLQIGKEYLPTNFDKGELIFNLLLFCVMCPLDLYYNNWYWYAPFVTVLMKDKKDMEFIDPLLQPSNSKK